MIVESAIVDGVEIMLEIKSLDLATCERLMDEMRRSAKKRRN